MAEVVLSLSARDAIGENFENPIAEGKQNQTKASQQRPKELDLIFLVWLDNWDRQ